MQLTHNNLKERIKGNFIEVLGIEFLEDDKEMELVGRMKVTKALSQTVGVLHGGATIALAETLGGISSNNICQEDEVAFGMQISASHVSSAQIGDTVRGVTTCIHKGRTTHVWDVNIYSESTRKLISSVRVTNAIVKRNRNS